jgi:uncharacterized membrane protein
MRSFPLLVFVWFLSFIPSQFIDNAKYAQLYYVLWFVGTCITFMEHCAVSARDKDSDDDIDNFLSGR